MIDINMSKLNDKPNILMRIGFFISHIGLLYKMGGFKNIYYSIKSNILIYAFKWKYRHCKKFRDKLQTQAKKQGMLQTAVLESFMNGTPLDFKSICENLTEEEKKEIRKNKERNINKVIEEYNITDEKQIAELREYADSMIEGKDILKEALNNK